MRRMICFFLAILMGSCGGGKVLKIGIDSNWYPQDFHGQESLVNGFVDDLLLEISRDSGLEIKKVSASWDNLTDGLKNHRYQGIFSSLPPYNFNRAKYDFSRNFLNIGPTLIVAEEAKIKGMKQLMNEVVGILSSDASIMVMQQYPNVLTRSYNSAPDALEALINGEVKGVVLDHLQAISFVRGIYAHKLKVIEPPLTDTGLHLVSNKKDSSSEIEQFNKSLQKLIKKKKVLKLLKKWQLSSP